MRLIDADANIETMKKCAENPEDKYALLCYRYAQMVLEEAPTVEPVPPWHRVEEPPKEDGKYVAINAKANWWYEARYENGNWKAVDLFGQRWVVIHPTHWMPIEPPKEDA